MTEKKTPDLLVTFSGELPQKRQIVFQGGVGVDTPLPELHALLDKMRVALERQFAFGELPIHQMELEQQTKLAEEHAARITQVEENVYRDWNANGGRRGDVKLSHAQQKEKEQAYANAESIKARIAKVKEWIAAAEAKIAG